MMVCTLGTLALHGLIGMFLIMIIFNELVKRLNYFWAEPVV